MAAGLLLGLASAALYLHGVMDGVPSVPESLSPRAARVDPFAVLWIPAVGGGLVAAGAVTRLRVAWVGVSVLAIFGTFYFTGVGWVFLLAAGLMAAVAGQIPPRRGALRKRGA